MTLLALMLLQAIEGLPPIAFDLGRLKPSGGDCASGTGSDIVVCARRHRPSDRIASGADVPDAMPRAEMKLFGQVRGSLHGQQNAVGGFPSNRVMATITVPF